MNIRKDIKLSNYTTLKIGGVARYFVEIGTRQDLREAVSFAKSKKLSIFVIGEGSDILISDKKFNVLVIKLTNKDMHFKGGHVVSSAGIKWDRLVQTCVDKSLQGIECLSGIPGTVGAAPVQNVGAYGQELKDTLVKVEVYDVKTDEFKSLNNKDCTFSYRESIFKNPNYKNRYIIFEVTLKLKEKGTPNVSYESLKKYLSDNKIKTINLIEVRDAILVIRHQKLDDPMEIPNAGSFFKNPIIEVREFENIQKKFPDIPNFTNGKQIKLFAGWLIEKCEWKGKKIREVGVSKRNALVLINYGKGTAEDMEKLARKVTENVYQKFGIMLESEVQYVNF